MGCRGCPGGGGGRVTPAAPVPRAAQEQPPPPDGDYVYVEYTGLKAGSVIYRGPSGQRYRFAAIDSDRVKLVRGDDAAWFARLTDFRIREPEAPVP